MKTALLAGALSASFLAAGAAAAQPRGSGVAVPTLQLSGSTSGKGRISAGVDFRTSRSPEWDIFLSPSFAVSNSDGSATILGFSSENGPSGPTQVSGSLSMSFAYTNAKRVSPTPAQRLEEVKATALCAAQPGVSDPTDAEKKASEAFFAAAALSLIGKPAPEDAAAHAAFAAALGRRIAQNHAGCTFAEADESHAARCTCASPTPACSLKEVRRLAAIVIAEAAKDCPGNGTESPICDWLSRPERAKTLVDRAKLCEAGRRYLQGSPVMKEIVKALPEVLYPEHLIALGVTYGAASFRFLESVNGTLGTTKATRSSVSANALYTFVRDTPTTRFTFELPIGFQLSWRESAAIASQCKPAIGMIGGESVQECKQIPLNGPTRGLQLNGAAYFGVARVMGSDLWRAAIGPAVMFDFEPTASTTYQVGGQVPLYLSLTKATGIDAEYQGIVRIMPTVVAERVNGTLGANATLTIALLGKRKMFGTGLFFP